MADMVTMQIIGLDAMSRKIIEVAQKKARECGNVVEDAVAAAKDVADELCPVRTGYLRSRNKTQRTTWSGGLYAASLTNDAPYAAFVIFGTRYMRAQDFFTPAFVAGRRRLEEGLKTLASSSA